MKKEIKKKEISQQFRNLIVEYKNALIEVLDGSSFAKMIAKVDKEKFEQFKAGTFVSDKDYDYRNMHILSLLESLGFPMDELGTYLYKELIMEVKNQLKKIEDQSSTESYKELYDNLNDFDSNLYLWVASDYLEMGRKSFMFYMKQAFDKIDRRKTKKAICESLFAGEKQPNYAFQTIQLGMQALTFDSYTKETAKVLSNLK